MKHKRYPGSHPWSGWHGGMIDETKSFCCGSCKIVMPIEKRADKYHDVCSECRTFSTTKRQPK